MTVKAFLLRRYIQRVDPEHKGRGSRVLVVSFFKDHISLGSMHNVQGNLFYKMFVHMLCRLKLKVSSQLQIFIVKQHKSFATLEVRLLFSPTMICLFVELSSSCMTY
jgi:hypothetical protein